VSNIGLMEINVQDWPETFGSISFHGVYGVYGVSNFCLCPWCYHLHILTCGHSNILLNTFEDPKYKLVLHYVWRINWLPDRMMSKRIYGPEEALTLLPKILPKVLEAGLDTLDDFLQVVQDHPLSKYTDPSDRRYDLYKAAAEAAEKLLDRELFQVSAFFLHPHNRCGSLGISLFVQQMRERRALREREALKLVTDTPAGSTMEIPQDASVPYARHNNLNVMRSPFANEAPTFWVRFTRLFFSTLV